VVVFSTVLAITTITKGNAILPSDAWHRSYYWKIRNAIRKRNINSNPDIPTQIMIIQRSTNFGVKNI